MDGIFRLGIFDDFFSYGDGIERLRRERAEQAQRRPYYGPMWSSYEYTERVPVDRKRGEDMKTNNSPDGSGDDMTALKKALGDRDARIEELEAKVKTLDSKLASANDENASLTDALRQERADFINYKNRTSTVHDDAVSEGVEQTVKTLLPTLMDFDRMRESGDAAIPREVALSMVDKLENALKTLGVEKYGSAGDEFDPSIHDALMHRSATGDSVVVDSVVDSGWSYRGKPIRPARVVTTDSTINGSRE